MGTSLRPGSRRRRPLKATSILAMSGLLASLPALGGENAPRYFPLDEGNVWSLGDEDDPASFLRYEIVVLAREGDLALVRFHLVEPHNGSLGFRAQVLLRERGLEIDIELPGEGFVPFYRFGEESFIHRDWDLCDDKVQTSVSPIEDPVETHSGVYTGCISTGGVPRCGADGGVWERIWCPDVGLVGFFLAGPGGGGWAVLSSLQPIAKPFIRGDANADGSVNLSDAFATLNALFTHGEFHYLSCADAADANDDGSVDISDAIFTLSHLFVGGRPIPPPNTCRFPDEENPQPIYEHDPTPDGIHCASFTACCKLPQFCWRP